VSGVKVSLPPFTYRQAQHVFNRACEAAELHDVRVHDLRHTFGVHAVQAGVPEAIKGKMAQGENPDPACLRRRSLACAGARPDWWSLQRVAREQGELQSGILADL
jgi:Phage integrase family